jgi:hypothetical protein
MYVPESCDKAVGERCGPLPSNFAEKTRPSCKIFR